MISESGRYVIVFNGEIYNFQELRAELERLPAVFRPSFRGHSDTEVMLAAFERWGVEEALRRFNGMFAFALWDRRERVLHLARDRFGEKPVYYGWAGNVFLFGSELKALRAHPEFRPDISREAVMLLLRYGYIPAPYSIYKGVSKLPPASWLSLPLSGPTEPQPVEYWSVRDVALRGCAAPFPGTEQEAIVELEGLLRDAVRIRMVADVPLGAFLSGGIDSSVVVALMQAQSGQRVRTFTIGFHESGYNEAVFAKAVAGHLGTEHTELYVTPEKARNVVPNLPTLYDEPFADSSQIPTFLVSQLTRRYVTVSLSGDGGDEVFGGYPRYFWANLLWRKLAWVPPTARRALGGAMRSVPLLAWELLFRGLNSLAPAGLDVQNPVDRIQKLANLLAADNSEALYFRLLSHWDSPAAIVRGGCEPSTILSSLNGAAGIPDFTLRMMLLDTLSYLPDDILVKVDRASMAVSLESRAPFLDHRLVEFAWRLPTHFRTRHGQGKWILRQVLSHYVPHELFERPKAGFGIPIYAWLRGPLRAWAEELLDESRLRREGYFDPAPIRRKWTEHLSGRRNWFSPLWNVLMFQAWLEQERRWRSGHNRGMIPRADGEGSSRHHAA